jgi:lipopolysaccharide transport system permease protein
MNTVPLVPAREPSLRIRPGATPFWAHLKEAWTHHELLYFLIWRDLKVRYRQTFLGVTWVVLQPLLMALVFTVFLSKLVHVPSEGVPYSLFAYAGLAPWVFFSNSVSTCSYSLISNSYIVTKVYFPRVIIPTAVIGVRLVDFLVASIVLIGLMLAYGVNLTWNILWLPLIVAQSTLFTLAIGLLFSALHVRYRDIGTILPVLIQLWMFVSPVVYPSTLVPEKWRVLYWLNPMAGIVEAFRASLLGLSLNWTATAVSAAISVIIFVTVFYAFCRSEDQLVEVI